MATKKVNFARASMWTENMRINVEGTISGVVIEGFNHICAGKDKTAAELRANALKIMQDRHEKLLAAGR